MAAKRSLALLVATVTVAAVAAPALAATSVPVTVVGLGGTRQFAVEDIAGNPLTSLDLGTGGAQPFRTHVTDSAFLPSATGGNYDVTATLSNLYLKTGAGSTSTDFNYNVKVPSSALSIGFGSNPLSVNGLSLIDLPTLNLAGDMASCASLDGTLQGILGLNVLGVVIGSNSALSTLCTTLGVTGSSVAATVDATLQTVTSSLPLAKLPTALSGATGGTFTTPSFATGVGAFDTVGAAAAGGAVPSAVELMKGTTAPSLDADFAADLRTQIIAALPVPLTTASGAGAQTQLASVVGVLQSSSTPVLSQLGAVLNGLTSTQQSTVINSLFTSIGAVLPVIDDIHGITGNSYAFPVLEAAPTTPVAGTYGGTMTVTFVQS